MDVKTQNGRAFVLTSLGLEVYDIARPMAPAPVGWLTLPGPLESMHFVGERVFVAGGTNGVWILDVSRAEEPVLVGRVETVALGVSKLGDQLLVADGATGVLVLPLPSSDSTTSAVHVAAGRAQAVLVDGDMAYVASGSDGLYILDVQDRSEPTVLARLESLEHPSRLRKEGPLLYVADGPGGLVVVDVSDPPHPEIRGRYSATGFAASDVALSDGRAFVTARQGMLSAFDTIDPDALRLIKRARTPGDALAIDVQEGVAYVAGGGAGLSVYDAASELRLVGGVDASGYASDLRLQGGRAYVSDREGGIRIVDVSEASSPAEIGTIGTEHPSFAVAIEDDYLFSISRYQEVAFRTDGQLEVFDLSAPLGTAPIGRLEIGGWTDGVAASRGFLFVADIHRGLVVLDVRDPRQPARAATLGPFGLSGVSTDGRYVFASERFHGLVIYDAADVAAVVEIARIETDGESLGLSLEGDLVALADGTSGLRLYDVSDRTNPLEVSHLPLPGRAHDVHLSGDRAFVSAGGLDRFSPSGSVQVVDVTDPSQPVLLGDFETPGEAVAVAGAATGLAIADGEALLTSVTFGCETDE